MALSVPPPHPPAEPGEPVVRGRSRHQCWDPQCSACNDQAAAREIERDYPEPLSPDEEARLDNWAEKQMEAMWQ